MVISRSGGEWPWHQMTLCVCPQWSVGCHNDQLLPDRLWTSDVRHSQTTIKLLLFDDHGWHQGEQERSNRAKPRSETLKIKPSLAFGANGVWFRVYYMNNLGTVLCVGAVILFRPRCASGDAQFHRPKWWNWIELYRMRMIGLMMTQKWLRSEPKANSSAAI